MDVDSRLTLDEQLVHCMRCGLCLPTCPTYTLSADEKLSPRGRIALMRANPADPSRISAGFAGAMELCLGCLACQTACPAGVHYSELLEGAWNAIEEQKRARRGFVSGSLRDFVLKKVLPSPHSLEPLLPLLRFYQKSGIAGLNLARILPGPLGALEPMLPPVPPRSTHQALGTLVPAAAPEIGRVGLLTGCLENGLLAHMGIATARVLARNGFTVVVPRDQLCCGALPAHLGELETARREARRNIDVFESAGVDVVISDAAGCSAQLKEYGKLLADDPDYRERAARFAARAYDVTEFLASHLPLRGELHALNLRAAYDDPCHLVHAQGISAQPRALLRSLPGVELVELPESTQCCGSAGTYNILHVKEATAILDRKLDFLSSLDVDVLAVANTGCYMQLAYGVKRRRIPVEVIHLVELIDRAYS